jgi:hypothetical protein
VTLDAGRQPSPISDLFATAVHRFGRAWADLVLVTLGLLAVASVPVVAADRGGTDGADVVVLGIVCYSLAYFALLAYVVLRGLPGRAPVTQVVSAYATAIAAGLIAAGLLILLGPFAVLPLPLILLAVPAAAAGDRNPLGALLHGALLAVRTFTRTWLVWLLALAFSLPIWIGVALVVFPLVGGGLQFLVTLFLSSPVIWPCSALFVRALYGDLTGRLVIRDAPGEGDRQADLERRGRRR